MSRRRIWAACRLTWHTDDDGVSRPDGWRIAKTDQPDVVVKGTSMATLIATMESGRYDHLVCENLDIDGRMIIDAMLDAGYESTESLHPDKGQMAPMITEDGRIVRIKVSTNSRLVDVDDMLRIVPIGLPSLRPMVCDGDTDWRISDDVCIAARMLRLLLDEGLNRVTLSTNAYQDYLDTIGRTQAKRWYPTLTQAEYDTVAAALHGGIVYLDRRWQGKDTGPGISVDANSLYPSVALSSRLPVGKPRHFDGTPPKDGSLYIVTIVADWELKDDGIPCMPRHYCRDGMEESHEPTIMTLTSVDLDLIMENYDLDIISWHGGLAFDGRRGLFDAYIHKWGDVKMSSTGARRLLAKLMLNALIGKFGSKTLRQNRKVTRVDGHTRYELSEYTRSRGIYVPVAAFVNAYARRELCAAMRANHDRVIYADTDSMHLMGMDNPQGIRIDQSAFGAWKVEKTYTDAKHLREKAYIWVGEDGEMEIKCSGMPKNIKERISWDDFKLGWTNTDKSGHIKKGYGRVIPVPVNRGIRYCDTKYTI